MFFLCVNYVDLGFQEARVKFSTDNLMMCDDHTQTRNREPPILLMHTFYGHASEGEY